MLALGAVERHQQRELAIGEPDRAQGRIKTPRYRPGCLLKVKTQAGVANPACNIDRQIVIGC
jgi:hypothetical protein